MTNAARNTSIALAAVGAVLLVVLQFVPWATFEQSGFGGSFTAEMRTWERSFHGSGFGFSGSDSTGWYDGDADDDEGVGLIRAAIPLLLAGLAAGVLGLLLTATSRGAVGGILTLVAALAAATGTVLFIVGIDRNFNDLDADYTWSAGFYLAILGSTALLAAGITGVAAPRSGAVAS